MKKQTKSGFTLIELMVVISIISLLTSVSLSALNVAKMRSRDARRIEDFKQIQLALELYRDDFGYYPGSNCGWDCNGYRYSYISGVSTSAWDALANDLLPYIKVLPKDPINAACTPWTIAGACHSYTYGNVGRNNNPHGYDLTARLEDPNSPYRCGVKGYRFYFNDSTLWCVAFGGSYSNQIYEGSIPAR
ncbi:MAG: hypothetical protein AB200_02195 [Parcubacteria bacterium C7867-005]|nr:MAG: hypothetical protein AB200_02195 [Parcubacteria bacterium C7867-005]